MTLAEAIAKNLNTLLRCTTINVQVIDYLRANDVIDDAQESELKYNKSPHQQLHLLFSWLREKSHSQEPFFEVMRETEQEHVANLLTEVKEGDDVPLSDAIYTRLVRVRPKLGKYLIIGVTLMLALRASKAISETDYQEINAENRDFAKNSKLISAVMRRSSRSFKSFELALREDHHDDAANYLLEGEVTAVHMNTNRPDLDRPLSDAFNNDFANRSLEDALIKEGMAKPLQKFNGIHLVRAVPGQSIVVFMYYKTPNDAGDFLKLWNSGELRTILLDILNSLLGKIAPENKEPLEANLSLDEDEIISFEEFSGIEGLERICGSKTMPTRDSLASQEISRVEEIEEFKKSFYRERLQWKKERDQLLLDKKLLLKDISELRLRMHSEMSTSAEYIHRKRKTELRDLPVEMLDKILLKTVPAMMLTCDEVPDTFDELLYQVLDQLRTVSSSWNKRFFEINWTKIKLRRFRDKSVRVIEETRSLILNVYAQFVSDVNLDMLSDFLKQNNAVKDQIFEETFAKNRTKESRCRAILDYLFTEGHPLGFLVLRRALEERSDPILEYMHGRKPCSLTTEDFLTNDEIRKRIGITGPVFEQFVSLLDPDRIGDWLKQERIITIPEWQKSIASAANKKDRCRRLLNYFWDNLNPRAFIIIRQVLVQDKHPVLKLIDSEPFVSETEDDLRTKILKHMAFLAERMDSDFGLLDILLERKALTRRQLFKIKSSPNEVERNEMLLDHILESNSTELLLSALVRSGQSHLYNYLEADGVYRSEFGNEWPLTAREIAILDTNQEMLVDFLETENLISRLYSAGVINRRQHEFMSSKTTSYERNEALLNILKKRSINDYISTIKALAESNQDHIVKILEGDGGVVVKLGAHLDISRHLDVSAVEDEIRNLLRNRSPTEINRIMELVQLNVIAARKGH